MVQEGRVNPESTPGAAATGSADVRRDVETIKSDLAALRADLSALIGSAVNAGKVQAGDARERLSTAARSRLDQFESAYGDLNSRGREVVDGFSRRSRNGRCGRSGGRSRWIRWPATSRNSSWSASISASLGMTR